MKKTSAILLAGTLCLGIFGCGDDSTKTITTVAGAGAGAYIGNQMLGDSHKTLKTVVGAAAGAGLGYFLGGKIGGK